MCAKTVLRMSTKYIGRPRMKSAIGKGGYSLATSTDAAKMPQTTMPAPSFFMHLPIALVQ